MKYAFILILFCTALTASGQWCEIKICTKAQQIVRNDAAGLLTSLDYGGIKCIRTTVAKTVLAPIPAILNGTVTVTGWIVFDRIIRMHKNSKFIVAPYGIGEFQVKMEDSTSVIIHKGAQVRFGYLERLGSNCVIVMSPGSTATAYDNNGVLRFYTDKDHYIVGSWGEQIQIVTCAEIPDYLDNILINHPDVETEKPEPDFESDLYYARTAKPTEEVAVYTIQGMYLGKGRIADFKFKSGTVYFVRSNEGCYKLILN